MKKSLLVCCLALFTTAARPSSAQTPTAAPAHKIRVLVLTGSSDWSHPWQGTAPFMQGILTNTGRFDVKLEEEVAGITSATLANYDVLIDYYYGPRWPEVTEKAVEESRMDPFLVRPEGAQRSLGGWKGNPGLRFLT